LHMAIPPVNRTGFDAEKLDSVDSRSRLQI
jgi:hypothetical protein